MLAEKLEKYKVSVPDWLVEKKIEVEKVLAAVGRRPNVANVGLDEVGVKYDRAGIKVEYQDYQHPEYPQLHGAFEPRMGALDLLFNVGGEAGREILMGGHRCNR